MSIRFDAEAVVFFAAEAMGSNRATAFFTTDRHINIGVHLAQRAHRVIEWSSGRVAMSIRFDAEAVASFAAEAMGSNRAAAFFTTDGLGFFAVQLTTLRQLGASGLVAVAAQCCLLAWCAAWRLLWRRGCSHWLVWVVQLRHCCVLSVADGAECLSGARLACGGRCDALGAPFVLAWVRAPGRVAPSGLPATSCVSSPSCTAVVYDRLTLRAHTIFEGPTVSFLAPDCARSSAMRAAAATLAHIGSYACDHVCTVWMCVGYEHVCGVHPKLHLVWDQQSGPHVVWDQQSAGARTTAYTVQLDFIDYALHSVVLPSSMWLRDLTSEGVEPHPGPPVRRSARIARVPPYLQAAFEPDAPLAQPPPELADEDAWPLPVPLPVLPVLAVGADGMEVAAGGAEAAVAPGEVAEAVVPAEADVAPAAVADAVPDVVPADREVPPPLDDDSAEAAAALEAEYADVLADEVARIEEEARRARVARVIADDLRPQLERDCAICMEPLADESSNGPALSLDCHRTHCFHASCIGHYWRTQQGRRCPCCRRPHSEVVSQRAGADWLAARQAEDQRISAEWDESAAWEALPCAQRIDLPTARPQQQPVAQQVAGEWHCIDTHSVLDCVLSPCGHVLDVPSELRVDWARARSEVFEQVEAARQSGDALALERALKWQLCLHDVLLRGPRRGTRGSSRMVGHLAARFDAWRQGRRAQLLRWWRDDRARGWERSRMRERQHAAAVHEEERGQQAEEVLALVRDGELSRAMRLLHSLGIAGLSERILAQLAAKHPERQQSVPLVVPGLQASRVTVSLSDTFRRLRRRAGTGVSGHRNEYLRALVGSFGDPVADRVMPLYDAFATSVVNAELPPWFYSAEAIARLLPLVKARLSPAEEAAGREPDARPIALGETGMRAIGRHITAEVADVAADVLAPQQLAVGVPGGISVLIHGIRLTLEQHPGFVVVRVDLRNAYNSIGRAVLIRRMAARPEFAHLVPFLHAMSASGSDLIVGRLGQRLFPGAARADSSDGVQQGMAMSSLAFSVGIHPELVALDAELTPFGGVARAIMDDVYACGPASVVFPAVQRFCQTLRLLTGLESHVGKFACYSPSYDLLSCPWRADLGAAIGCIDGRPDLLGVMVGGVPVGSDEYITAALTSVADGVIEYIDSTVERLADHPHALWAALYYCCQSRFDFWLRHLEPHFTRSHAHRLDQAMLRAASRLTYDGCLDDPLTRRRFHLAARYRGCGVRRRVDLAPIAFCASFVESASQLLDRAAAPGAPRDVRGYFPALWRTLGHGAFDPGGHRFDMLISSSSKLGGELEEHWDALAASVAGAGSTGPLEEDVTYAGRGCGGHLQRQITEQWEGVCRDRLHRDVLQLPRDDTRRVAWMSVDRLSSQWVSSWPTRQMELSDLEMPEVITTYLGRESSAVRALAGRLIPCGRRGGQPRTCDAYGFEIGLATLPGTSHTDCHDAASWELFDLLREASLPIELQPRHVFTTLIPPAVLLAPGRPPSIVPDAAIEVSLPPVVTRRGERRGAPLPRRRLLFDAKTIHAGAAHYYSAHARDEQSGAVRHREAAVWPAYLGHARALDRDHSPAGTTPIADRLRWYTATRGLVFGAYGEASADVHALIRIAAEALARQRWRFAGARTPSEMQSFLVGQARRRVGLATVQAMARHRLARVPYIGVPRAVVAARVDARAHRGAARPAPAWEADDLYAFQARAD